MSTTTTSQIEAIEQVPIQDTFVTALARIENIGPCRRLVLVALEIDHAGRQSLVVVGKVIVPAEALPAIAAKLLEHAPAEAALALATAARDGATSH